MANWSHLPEELTVTIGGYISTYTDYVRFRAVCSSWRNSLPKWPKHLYSHVPWLMLPHCHPDHQNLRGFYNPLNHELFYLSSSESRDQFCCGSSSGWIVTLENNGLNLKLLNPLTQSQLILPPISSFPDVRECDPNLCGNEYPILRPTINNFTLSQALVHVVYLDKIVFSPCSPSNDFVAVAIHGRYSNLSFTKSGEEKWTTICSSSLQRFQDCIIFNRKIYVIDADGKLMFSHIDAPTNMVNMGLRQPKLMEKSKLYLVKTDDDKLLLVERLLTIEVIKFEDWNYCCNYKTIGFNLFKLVLRRKMMEWLQITNLDDYTIFLGLNTSICISSRYCPTLMGNHIYYTDDQAERHIEDHVGRHDFGVFDIASKSCRSLLDDYGPANLFVWPPPIWVTLNPH